MTDRKRTNRLAGIAITLCCLLPAMAQARLDLAAAQVEELANGMTLIVLEEPAFPLVSVQMLYKSGARHEITGATGLAHFLEHMAFRATEAFPDTEVVSRIYAAGGEWHGYTWLDQTTYYATAPASELDLLLRIEADRMARLLIPAGDVEAERGAVLAEMHGYENDPATVLQDYVLYTSFLAHGYRNNTIGWEDDIDAITHADLVDFYERHYHPANAVLAVVGDIDASEVRRLTQAHFGVFERSTPVPPPHTAEPLQGGERRVRLSGPVERKLFKLAYRAPAARHADFPAFLVLQELLAGGSGVSFLQNDWGTAARQGSFLDGITGDLTTWFPPMAEDYVFTISGSVAADTDEEHIEKAIDEGVGRLRQALGGESAQVLLDQARNAVQRELLFDVQTTEDAAHQLAYFAGLDALPVLLDLPERVAAVVAEDLLRLIETRLDDTQRTLGWYVPGSTIDTVVQKSSLSRGTANKPAHEKPMGERSGTAHINALDNGLPVVLQRSALSATAHLRLVVPGRWQVEGAEAIPDTPVWGMTALDYAILPGELGQALEAARATLADSTRWSPVKTGSGGGPEDLLQQRIERLLGLSTSETGPSIPPSLVLLAGDIHLRASLAQIEKTFKELSYPPATGIPGPLMAPSGYDEQRLPHAIAQEQLAYVVRAPALDDAEAPAWQILQYILSHGYEGRLGKEAISRRGLLYYIDSAYHGNGAGGWITMTMGVDPEKREALQMLLQNELQRLRLEPPTQAEIDEARQHLLGRQQSAAQSNLELVARHGREWFGYGGLLDRAALEQRLGAIDRQTVLDILPAFTGGAIVAVRNPEPNAKPGR